MYIHNGCRAIDTVQYMSNLIKIRSTHLLPIFYRCFFGRSCSRSNNPPLTVVSGVSMNTLSQIYISQSEIESTLQNNQSDFESIFNIYNRKLGTSLVGYELEKVRIDMESEIVPDYCASDFLQI